MATRFRKSVKIAPGVKVNIGKKSASVSVGGKGAHITANTKGQVTKSASIPGTGVSWRFTSGGRGRSGSTPMDEWDDVVELEDDDVEGLTEEEWQKVRESLRQMRTEEEAQRQLDLDRKWASVWLRIGFAISGLLAALILFVGIVERSLLICLFGGALCAYSAASVSKSAKAAKRLKESTDTVLEPTRNTK